MGSVREVAAAVTRALSLVSTARTALVRAGELLGDATTAWGSATRGSTDPGAMQLPQRGESEIAAVEEHASALNQAERLLRAYLDRLGVTGVAPPGPTSPNVPRTLGTERVEQARQRVGKSTTAGGEARGEWVRSDGWSIRVTSGAGDEHHDAVVRFTRASKLPPAVTRLARHVEVKVAVAMREGRLRDETLVIDRQVCGRRPFDRAQPFTCDKYLASVLPPGARLRVVEADGTVATYIGKEDGPHDSGGGRSHVS